MNDAFEPVEPSLQQPLEYLRSVLIPSETLEAWAVQHRLFALSHRRVLVAATSGRLIMITRHLISGFDVSDIRCRTWRKLLYGSASSQQTLRSAPARHPTWLRRGRQARGDSTSRGCAKPRHRPCIASARRRIRPGVKNAVSASSRSCARAPAGSRSARVRHPCGKSGRRRFGCGPAATGGQADARRQAHHRCGVRGYQGKDFFLLRPARRATGSGRTARSGSAVVERLQSFTATARRLDRPLQTRIPVADLSTERPPLARTQFRLFFPYIAGDIYGSPTTGDFINPTLGADYQFEIDLNRSHKALLASLEPTELSVSYLHIEPATARVARLAPMVLQADGIEPVGRTDWVDGESRRTLLLLYFDRPASIQGVGSARGKRLRYAVQAASAGYVWVGLQLGTEENVYTVVPAPSRLLLAVAEPFPGPGNPR